MRSSPPASIPAIPVRRYRCDVRRGDPAGDAARQHVECEQLRRPEHDQEDRHAAGTTSRSARTPAGNPTTIQPPNPIKTGPYEGLIALQTPYQIDVTAKTSTGGEVHLSRTIESVAIPVFQFGTFSDVDLSFFAGPNFNFGGRVHTNGNLFLSQGTGATLTLAGKVTAVKEVVRQRLQNGVSIDTAPAHAGIVSMATSASAFRDLVRTEGSVVDFPVTNPANPDPSWNEPTWHGISLSSYNSWIRNGRTGAKTLNLPLITVGGTNPDLIRRPPVERERRQPGTVQRAIVHQREHPDPVVRSSPPTSRTCRR